MRLLRLLRDLTPSDLVITAPERELMERLRPEPNPSSSGNFQNVAVSNMTRPESEDWERMAEVLELLKEEAPEMGELNLSRNGSRRVSSYKFHSWRDVPVSRRP